ncbi:MAG: Maf family protein [Solirubrobacteraceae bacterium]
MILASGSPQRRAILAQLGVEFTVVVSHVEERQAGDAEQTALENARRKAWAVRAGLSDAASQAVLGVDTVVELDGHMFGKPPDRERAVATLCALGGRSHRVISGIHLIRDGRSHAAAVVTDVTFRALDDSLIDWYVATGEWRGRAGGYAIQGRGAALVSSICGDYLNVVGLPVAKLLEIFPTLLFPASF